MNDEADNSNGAQTQARELPGPKWKARAGLARLKLNGAEYAVMMCLIDRWNPKNGLCYPSEEFIAGWTDRNPRAVRRARESDAGLVVAIRTQ